jgi:hypothetical protein
MLVRIEHACMTEYHVYFSGFLVGISLHPKKLHSIDASELFVDGGLAQAHVDTGNGNIVCVGALSAVECRPDQEPLAQQHR